MANPDDATLASLTAKVDGLMARSTETNATIRELTAAVNKLAIIEERQTNDRAAQTRAFAEIAAMQVTHAAVIARIEKIELGQPMNGLTNSIVFKGIALVLTLVVGANINSLMNRQPAVTAVTVQAPAPIQAPVR